MLKSFILFSVHIMKRVNIPNATEPKINAVLRPSL